MRLRRVQIEAGALTVAAGLWFRLGWYRQPRAVMVGPFVIMWTPTLRAWRVSVF